mmetsp:Transcript_7010/g.9901  ORF Transcript_7010/g.9901 Transcript_7010/m.9901 type:complete len:124 (-) Transcript_7010:2378-2749(-)
MSRSRANTAPMVVGPYPRPLEELNQSSHAYHPHHPQQGYHADTNTMTTNNRTASTSVLQHHHQQHQQQNSQVYNTILYKGNDSFSYQPRASPSPPPTAATAATAATTTTNRFSPKESALFPNW